MGGHRLRLSFVFFLAGTLREAASSAGTGERGQAGRWGASYQWHDDPPIGLQFFPSQRKDAYRNQRSLPWSGKHLLFLSSSFQLRYSFNVSSPGGWNRWVKTAVSASQCRWQAPAERGSQFHEQRDSTWDICLGKVTSRFPGSPVHQTGHLRTSHYCCCLKNEVPSMRWKKPHIWCFKWMKVGLVSGSPKHFTQKHGQCQEMALHTFLEPIANFNGFFYFNAAIWVTLILWGGTWSLVTSPSWIFTRIEARKQAEGGIIWPRRGIWGS